MTDKEKKIKRYAELKILEKTIKKELSQLKAEVTSVVFDEDNQLLETSWGKFELRPGTKKWRYSAELLLKEAQVKEMLKAKKKQEELNGMATLEKVPTNLIFTMEKK